MKLLMSVYNYLNTDARVQRSINALKNYYDLTVISIEDSFEIKGVNMVKFPLRGKNHMIRYFNFCKDLINYAKKNSFDLFYFHDLYMAYPLLKLRRIKRNIPNIYDCHETIFPQKGIHFSMRDYFFYYFDKKATIKADNLICAQIDRAKIIVKRYNLKKMPTIINNISILKDNEITLPEETQKTLDTFFNNRDFSVVYAGGINNDRNIMPLVEAVKGTNYKLLLIGNGNIFEDLKTKIKEENINNCTLLGKVPYNCLGQIIKMCNCGYVSYGIQDVNNKYCASNKIYEYCSVNVPILATDNPTIKKVVEEYSIGVCSNDISSALLKLKENYLLYRNNTTIFNDNNKWEYEELKLLNLINSILKKE